MFGLRILPAGGYPSLTKDACAQDSVTSPWRARDTTWGIVLGDDIEGDYSTLAQVRDPDGNLLTLATPPSRPFPPA